MSTIRVKGPENFGGFTHAGEGFAPDEYGVIEIPAHIPNEVLAAHSLTPAPAKSAPKPLAKADDAKSGGGKKPKTDKPEDADDAKSGGGK